jgi:hypothetical protein
MGAQMSAVGPKSTADVRQFLAEATGCPVLGCEFQRTAQGFLTMSCGYVDGRGSHHTKQLALGIKNLPLREEVADLAVMMSEWIEHGEGHMMELLDSSREPVN